MDEIIYPRVLPVGETAFTVELGNEIDAALNRRVHALDAAVRTAELPGVVETVPTYRSLLVMVDPDQIGRSFRSQLLSLARSEGTAEPEQAGHLLEIPVRYGGEDGPDLTAVADYCGLESEEVVRRHTAADYQVAMLGFAPGFAYLLGLPEGLATPRLTTPRLQVPPGSVGIAGGQTGIYALATPGGWRIIGRTPLKLFDPAREDPFLIKAGDRLRFVALG